MTDLSQFEIIGTDPIATAAPVVAPQVGPDLSQFEMLGIAPQAGERTWGDTLSNLGRSFATGSTNLATLATDYNPLTAQGDERLGQMGGRLFDALAGTHLSDTPAAQLERINAQQGTIGPALNDLRQSYIGNPDYSKANWPERYAGAGAQMLPMAALGGGVLPAIVSGATGEAGKDVGLPEWVGQVAGGGLTGLAQDAAGTVVSEAPTWADALENKALGITKGDFTLSGRRSGLDAVDYVQNADGTVTRVLNESPQTKLEAALQGVKENGLLENGTDPASVWATAQKNVDGLNSKIDAHIAVADEARQGAPVEPSYENAQRYIDEQAPSVDRPALRDKLDNFKQAVKDEGDGSYAYLQNEKQELYKKTYDAGQQSAKGFDKALGLDLKQTIESGAPQVAPLNQELGQYLEVLPKLERTVSQGGADNPLGFLSNLTRTTGGIMGTGAVAGILGHGSPLSVALGLGLGSGIRYLGTPAGLMNQARALRGISNLSENAPGWLEGLATQAAPLTSHSTPMAVASDLLSTLEGSPAARVSGAAAPVIIAPHMIPQAPISAPPYAPMSQAPPELNRASVPDTASKDLKPTSVSSQSVNDLISKQSPLVRALIRVESGNDPSATSKAGAVGLTQLMPATASRRGVDATDPAQNIQGGTAELKSEVTKWKDPYIAIAAYNAGDPKIQTAVNKAKERGLAPTWANISPFLPKETREYPGKIVAALKAGS